MTCTLLLVEDHLPSRRNLSFALQSANHNVYEAETGEAALNLLSSVDFQVVISDYRLPGITNGIDVLRRQREKSAEARLVLMTAFGSREVETEAAALRAVYIEKPFSLSDILSIVAF
jgi:DNA-binding NtrC family response regulator